MKCDDCQKLFPNEDGLVWHASKTGHTNFSESQEAIKPKTPEEIVSLIHIVMIIIIFIIIINSPQTNNDNNSQQAAKQALEARIKENRRLREEKERQEELDKERMRRTQGREIVELRQKFKVIQKIYRGFKLI